MNSALSQLGRRSEPPPISWLMELTLARPKMVSLAAGFTDNESLPVTEARELLDELLRSRKAGRPALQYGSTAGDPLLRRLTAEELRGLDGGGAQASAWSPDRVVITHGSQQLLYMVTEALCDAGDIVLVEDPTYFVFLGIAQSHALHCRGVTMEPDGIDLSSLERVLEELRRNGELQRVKMLYLVSHYQNPTGYTTSLAKKAAALALLRRYERAAGHPIYLLEDAAYRELRFTGADTPSALTVRGAQERVIYTSTFSKPFASGIRVGYGVLPEPVRTVVTRIKGNHDFGTANLLQQLVSRALASGAYARHLPVMRRRYARKARVMAAAMRAHFPAPVEWREAEGGLYIWARLPRRLKSGAKSRLFQKAMDCGVLYVPGEICYASDPARPRPNHEMRLSFGGATESNIGTGIERLGRVLRRML